MPYLIAQGYATPLGLLPMAVDQIMGLTNLIEADTAFMCT
jgi:hypothetical protein